MSHSIRQTSAAQVPSLDAAPIRLTISGDRCTANLAIKGVPYAVEFLPDGADGERTVRLEKLAGANEIYDVTRHPDGLTRCSCPAYVFRLEGTSATCKHGNSVNAAGLLDDYDPSLDLPATSTRVRTSPAPDRLSSLPPLSSPDGRAASDARWAALATMQPFGEPDAECRSADVLRDLERLADEETIAAFEAWRDSDPVAEADRAWWGDEQARMDAVEAMEAEERADAMEAEMERERSGRQFPDWPWDEIVQARGERVASGREG